MLVAAVASAQVAPDRQPTDPAAPELASIAELAAAGELATAESRLRALVAAADGAAARDLLGLVLLELGRAGEAEREFRRALELEPAFAPSRLNLGRVYLQQGRSDAALTELRAAARIAPLGREAAFQLAALELSEGTPSAGESLLQSLADEFDSVRAMLDLARLEARRGDNQAALELLDRALELAPNSEEVLSAHARVLLAVEAPVPAIDELTALTRMHPTVAAYSYLMGVALLQIGETAPGIESLQSSLARDPRQALAHIALGLGFNHLKRFAEAREALRQALRLMPGNVEVLIAMAEAEEGLGNLDSSERHAKRALELAPGHPEALFVRGKIRMSQGRFEEARDALAQSVAANPKLSKAHYQLSLAYARLRDRESSQRHLELYRQALENEEAKLIELRTAAGLGVSGMGRGG